MRTAPATPATAALTRLGVEFAVRTFEHRASGDGYGAEAAAALGVDPARVFKTLVADAEGRLVVGVVPVTSMLDLKALAEAVGAKRAVLADPAAAERRTGYVVGGISPIGQRSRLPVVLDASAGATERILVSGGRRGLEIELTPADLLRATDGVLARIARTDR